MRAWISNAVDLAEADGPAHVRLDGFLASDDDDFESSLNLNFFAALRATRAAVARMTEQGEGAIVNVASVNSFFEPDGAVIDYGAAKAALVNVAKSLSQELGPKGIRVTSVSPGQVATDLWLGEDGVAATVGRATGAGADAVREQAVAGITDGALHDPARSCHARRAAGIAADGQRDGRQLGDRRRLDQDDLSRGLAGMPWVPRAQARPR